ncbi:MAG: NERD domain-containing protein [Anaerolineae bacterium]|nr:NERD domain-containing protein [Anaerolineae bacterium]
MRNVAPTRSLTRRANQWKSIAFLAGALGGFALAVGILMNVIPLVGVNDPSFGVYSFLRAAAEFVGIVLLAVSAGMLIRAFTWRMDNDLAQQTAQVLGQKLDDRYTLIRNVSKREIGYIDAVLVGPAGVLVFRITDAEGDWANEGVNWLVRNNSGDLLPAPFNPTKECQIDMDRLGEFLRGRGVHDAPVLGVVVFTRDDRRVRLSARDSVIPISHLHLLPVNLGSFYLNAERMNMNAVTQVIQQLYDV